MPSAREKILAKLSASLAKNKLPMPFPEAESGADAVFIENNTSLAEQYATQFAKVGGRFVYCETNDDLVTRLIMLADTMNWKKIAVLDPKLITLFGNDTGQLILPTHKIDESDAAISLCERLVARSGSAVYSSAQAAGRQLPIYTPIHITVAFTSQLVNDWQEAKDGIEAKYMGKLPSMLSLTTGPSRTADIEKTLVIGVHGPQEVYTFLVEG